MNVAELRKLLSEYPDDLPVYVSGIDVDYDELTETGVYEKQLIKKDYKTEVIGRFTEAYGDDKGARSVVLGR